jgi:mutual gliding-motility protein MglA
MAIFNSAKKEINIKIVYCGPALCGKTTNVQTIHNRLAPHQRGEMVSLATKDDRTLFFDFLPIELGNVKGFKTRFHIYTVPGQVYYALTRRAVLTNVDGVVFVADSQTGKMEENMESFRDLEENLRFYKKDLLTTPFILQYNKRDLADIMPVEELNSVLNKLQVPFFESSAVQGPGVMETLTACCKLVLKQLDESSGKKEGPVIKIFKDFEPAAAPAPQYQEEPASDTGPVIRITSRPVVEEHPAATPVMPAGASPEEPIPLRPEQVEIPETIPITPSPSSTPPAIQDSYPGQGSAAGDISPADGAITQERYDFKKAATHDDGSLPAETSRQPLTLSMETEPAQDAHFTIVACGQPHTESATSIKIPLIFKISDSDKECLVNLIINFDNFTVREPR